MNMREKLNLDQPLMVVGEEHLDVEIIHIDQEVVIVKITCPNLSKPTNFAVITPVGDMLWSYNHYRPFQIQNKPVRDRALFRWITNRWEPVMLYGRSHMGSKQEVIEAIDARRRRDEKMGARPSLFHEVVLGAPK